MSKPITKIEMDCFRGATSNFEIEFDPSKDLTLLFGENGSGKSSIFDAIDYVCNNSFGAIEGISVGQNRSKYLCTLGKDQSDLKLTIHSNQDSWIGSMVNNVIEVTGSTRKPIVKSIRRNQILSLVNAEPANRYKELEHFIDISTVEKSETNLRLKIKAIKQVITSKTTDKIKQELQLNLVWEKEDKPRLFQNALSWAIDKIKRDISSLEMELSKLTKFLALFEILSTSKEIIDSNIADMEISEKELKEVNDKISDTSEVNIPRLIESLSKAKDYISIEESLEACPTCLRPISRDELLVIINNQLNPLEEIKKLTDSKSKINSHLSHLNSIVEKTNNILLTQLKEIQTFIVDNSISEFEALNISWPNWESFSDYPAAYQICQDIKSIIEDISTKKGRLTKDIHQFNSIKQRYDDITELEVELLNLDVVISGLEKVYDIIHTKRVNFTQKVLDEIKDEANRFYLIIHPEENIGLSRLTMKEAYRGSVNQTGVFHTHAEVPPQAIYSESHLDTLGFCVWLALAKRESAEDTILVIDDIFTSVDNQHIRRIIDLLNIIGSEFLQVIISTHFRLWWDKYQNAHNVQRIKLGKWTIGNGICAQNMPLVTEELESLIQQPFIERQSIASKAGILLENLLCNLAFIYKRKLPLQSDNNYMLGELLDASKKLFTQRHNLTVNRNSNWENTSQDEIWIVIPPLSAFERVTNLMFIRNQVGCHFNEPGAEISDVDIREFGEATIELVRILVCPKCGFIAKKVNNEGTALRCRCSNTIKMTPIQVN